MRIGETREIFIHPCLAYGIYTTLEKAIYLKACVQLLDFKNEPTKDITYQKLAIDISPTLEEDYKREAKKVGYATGYKLWQHYKKGKFYSLAQVLDLLKTSEDIDISSKEDQDLINRLHWIIYN